MKDLIKAFDKLPWLVKVILALPALDIVWAIYRIVKGCVNGNIIMIIAGIIWIFGGFTITWILDLIFIILHIDPLFTK